MVLFDELKGRYPFSDNPRPDTDVPIWSKPPNTDMPHEDKKDLYEKHIKSVAKKMVFIPRDSGKSNNNFPDSLILFQLHILKKLQQTSPLC